jgi:small subunit ribosomal protein S6e
MAKFKIVISDPETGKSQTVELEGPRAAPLVGKKLGENIDGTTVGMRGQKLRITGGSDKDGFPMRPDIHGGVKTRVIVAKSIGFHSTRKGKRKRKTMRGNVITEETFQINMRITEKPEKTNELSKTKRKDNQDSSGENEQQPRKRAKSTKTTEDHVRNS